MAPSGQSSTRGRKSCPTAATPIATWPAARLVSIGVTPTRSIKIFRNTDVKGALRELSFDGVDFAVVEGFKQSSLPKIAIGDVEAANVVARVDINATGEQLAAIAMAQPDRVTLFDLLAKVHRNPEIKKAGAIGTFTGIVREIAEGRDDEGPRVRELRRGRERAHREDRAGAQSRKTGIVDVLIHHKTGRIEAGEDIVYIVVAAGHRQELFPVLRDAIERIKEEVPIWKKELTVSGEYWVHDEEK